jgi:hypothetical protein
MFGAQRIFRKLSMITTLRALSREAAPRAAVAAFSDFGSRSDACSPRGVR